MERRMSPQSLFQAALGARFAELAPALRRFHRLSGRHELHGVVETDPPASTMGRVGGYRGHLVVPDETPA
jgi:hypothetical protein